MSQDRTLELRAGRHGPELVRRGLDDLLAERLAREADRLGRATHPGVVTLLRRGTDHLVLAWAGGETLETHHPDVAGAAAVVASLASTVADLHGLGIIHGRIDPSHVVIDPDGRPRLCGLRGADPTEREPQATDDVAALGALLHRLVARDVEPEPIPERRWGRRRWTGYRRRTLQTLADRATDADPARRPTARELAAAVAEAVPDALFEPSTAEPPPPTPTDDPGVPPDDPAVPPDDLAVPPTDDPTGAGPSPRLDLDRPGHEAPGSATPEASDRGPEPTADAPASTDGADDPPVPARRDPAEAREPGDDGPDHEHSERQQDDEPEQDRAPSSDDDGPDDTGRGHGGHVQDDERRQDDEHGWGDEHGRDEAPWSGDDGAADESTWVDPGWWDEAIEDEPSAPAAALAATDASPPDGDVGAPVPLGLRRPELPEPHRARRLVPLAVLGLAALVLVASGMRRLVAAPEPITPAAPASVAAGALPEDREPTDPDGRPGLAQPCSVGTGSAGTTADEARDGGARGDGAGLDVDGDGCADPVQVTGRRVTAGGHRYAVGRAGDRVAVADWDCDGIATVGLVRPGTGEVFAFPDWQLAGGSAAVRAATGVADAVELLPPADGSCRPSVRLRDGTSAPIDLRGTP